MAGDDIPRFFAVQLADAYTVRQLRRYLHYAEIERLTEMNFDERLAGFWNYLVAAYKAGIAHRLKVDEWRRMQQAKVSPKRRQKIDVQELVRTVKERVDIVEYVGRYVELRKQGNSFVGICPFHPDRGPSFVVWPRVQAFRCFGCDAKGDIITFVRLMAERG